MLTKEVPLRVLVIANDPLSRAGLAALVNDLPDCQTAGQLAAEAEWVDQIDAFQPDVIVWDSGWDTDIDPDILSDGVFDADDRLPIVMLVSDEESGFKAWSAGVTAILSREASPDHIHLTLHAAAAGLVIIDPALISALMRPIIDIDLPPVADLTPREKEVLHHMAEGLSNRAIAQTLSISEHTVKFHVNAIMTKLGAQSRTDAVVRATRSGLIIL